MQCDFPCSKLNYSATCIFVTLLNLSRIWQKMCLHTKMLHLRVLSCNIVGLSVILYLLEGQRICRKACQDPNPFYTKEAAC